MIALTKRYIFGRWLDTLLDTGSNGYQSYMLKFASNVIKQERKAFHRGARLLIILGFIHSYLASLTMLELCMTLKVYELFYRVSQRTVNTPLF